MTTRWLFGDQLGPHFVDDHRGALLMVESLGSGGGGGSTAPRRTSC